MKFQLQHVQLPYEQELELDRKPVVGELVAAPMPNGEVDEDSNIIYSVDFDDNIIEFGFRFVTIENTPMFPQVDLHLGIARCRRCLKVEHFDVKVATDGTNFGLNMRATTEEVMRLHMEHEDCEHPICLN